MTGAVAILRVPADSADALALIRALDADLQRRYPGANVQGLRAGEARDPGLSFFVARVDGGPAGCAALRALDDGTGEVKRMFVLPEHRGRGLARELLAAIEARARELGHRALRLETGDRQPEAVALYRSAGYQAIAPFGQYVGNVYSRCFEKRLD